MNHVNQRALGGQYEQYVATYMELQGMKVIEKNFRCKIGEIDLIARDGRYLVFVEVKFRKGNACGHAVEAVGYHKQKKICKTALYYLTITKQYGCPVRFDVAGVDGNELTYIKDAFAFCG